MILCTNLLKLGAWIETVADSQMSYQALAGRMHCLTNETFERIHMSFKSFARNSQTLGDSSVVVTSMLQTVVCRKVQKWTSDSSKDKLNTQWDLNSSSKAPNEQVAWQRMSCLSMVMQKVSIVNCKDVWLFTLSFLHIFIDAAA